MPFFRGLRLVMSHGPYIKLIAGFLFTSLAFMVSGGLICLLEGGVEVYGGEVDPGLRM